MKRRNVILICIAVLFCSCGAHSSPSTHAIHDEDFVVGGVPLGSDSSRVRAILGSPDSMAIVENPYDAGRGLAEWHYRSKGLVVYFGSMGQTVGEDIVTAGPPTIRGLRAGDKASKVRKLYGAGNESDGYMQFEDPKEALRVVRIYIRQGRVVRIYAGVLLD